MSISTRLLVPCYKTKGDKWPAPFSIFALRPTTQVQFRGVKVGKVITDPKYKRDGAIGIVCASSFQPEPALTYKASGYDVKYIAVTVDGFETLPVGNYKQDDGTTGENIPERRAYVTPNADDIFIVLS